jgi:hypothetical protein
MGLPKKVAGFVAVGAAALAANVANSADTTMYTYDVLGRVTHVQAYKDDQNAGTQSFQYDSAGNRTGMQVVTVSNLPPSAITPVSANVNLTSTGGTLVVNVGAAGASGAVAFYANDTLVETVLVTNGQARVVLRGFPRGTYTVTARYSGDANNGAATTTFTINIRDLAWLPAVLNLMLE